MWGHGIICHRMFFFSSGSSLLYFCSFIPLGLLNESSSLFWIMSLCLANPSWPLKAKWHIISYFSTLGKRRACPDFTDGPREECESTHIGQWCQHPDVWRPLTQPQRRTQCMLGIHTQGLDIFKRNMHLQARLSPQIASNLLNLNLNSCLSKHVGEPRGPSGKEDVSKGLFRAGAWSFWVAVETWRI